MPLAPTRTYGPLYTETRFKDLKDPCICFDGTTWHLFGSGGDTTREEWEIGHATAPDIEGPWTEAEPVVLRGVDGPHVAAPSVIFDPEDTLFHMAVQKDFMETGGGIAYLVSADGRVFTKMRTILAPNRGNEAGLYDPHFSVVKGKKFVVYSGVPEIAVHADRHYQAPQPDVYLAGSVSDRWSGHWKRMKAILKHEDISWHHNHREHPDYEWGIEGPQLVELPNGTVLLNATCFIEEGRRGTRQRVFFAIADNVRGPYVSLGPVLTARKNEWETGENGHASAIVHENELYLFYQARSQAVPDPKEANDWRYGLAVFSLEDIARARSAEENAS